MIIGLTGGIASGKSTALSLFEALNIPFVDADIVARNVVEPGTPALASIMDHFGHTIVHDNGELNRPALRQAIFANTEHKNWLEKLLHPLIRQQMLATLNNFNAPYRLLAAPLLFETKLDEFCDKTITLDVTEDVQLKRALLRDGSSAETLKSIISSQWSRQQRLDKADYILDNSGTTAHLSAQISALHQKLLLESKP